jgi:branched-chain amino acid transport system permease protein
MKRSGHIWQTRTVTILFVILTIAPWVIAQTYWQGVLIVALYYAILACAWNLLSGYGGQFSLAPAAFSLLGAYTTGVLNFHFGVPPLLGIAAAIPVTYIIGYGLGRIVLKMRGPYLALTTFAFLEVVELVIANSYSVTRGAQGLSLPGIMELPQIAYYYLFLAALLVTHLIVYFLLRSKIGLFIQAVRDDELAAASRGVDVVRWKIFLFALSSALSGFAGALYVHFINLASPEIGTVLQSGLVISMVVIGGMGTLPGPIIGAFLVEVGSEALRSIGVAHLLVFSALMILVVRFFRGGLWGLVERIARWRAGRAALSSDTPKQSADPP